MRAALEHGAEQHLGRTNLVLQRLERLLAEPSDTGIASQLTTFWAGWDDTANHPDDPAARVQLLERAETLAASFNHAATEIGAMRSSAIDELETMVDDVTSKASTVAQLNESIKNAQIAELDASDLIDRRDVLAQQLAGLVGTQIRFGEFGQVSLVLNGTSLVSEDRFEPLVLDASGSPVTIRWQKDNFPATVNSGAAGGLLETVNSVLPGYLADLDTVAMRLRDDVNALHGGITGSIAVADQDQSLVPSLDFQVGLNGGGVVAVPIVGADWSGVGGAAALQASLQAAFDGAIGAGNATVTVSGGNGSPLVIGVAPTGTNELQVQAVAGNPGFATLLGTTGVGLDGIGGRALFTGTDAASLSLSSLVDGVPDAIAAATAGGGALDGSRALELAELGSSATGADSLYRSFVVTLAVDGQTTAHRHEIQSQTAKQVDSARESISGVDIDEEMVNMVQFQHAYDASARYMTAVDDMLATLILRTGRVGL